MAKSFFCAKCGKELKVVLKALPSKAIVVNLVEPHECNPENITEPVTIALPKVGETTEEKKSLNEIFDSFPYVEKLNKEEEKSKVILTKPKDQRDKEHLRKEIQTSTAPEGILRRVPGAHSSPERGTGEFNGEE